MGVVPEASAAPGIPQSRLFSLISTQDCCRIFGAQHKMKNVFSGHEEFQDGHSRALNQAWRSPMCDYTGPPLVKPTLH